MIELVKVRAVIQLVGGKVASREITETPICELSREDLLRALRIGPVHYTPATEIDQEAITYGATHHLGQAQGRLADCDA